MNHGLQATVSRFSGVDQLLAASPAHPELLPSREHNGILCLTFAVNLAYPVKVDDRRPMNADEPPRAQAPVEFGDCLAQHVPAASDMQAVVIVAGFDPGNTLRRYRNRLWRGAPDRCPSRSCRKGERQPGLRIISNRIHLEKNAVFYRKLSFRCKTLECDRCLWEFCTRRQSGPCTKTG